MDKLKKYEKIVNDVILEVSEKLSDTDSILSIDKTHGQYLILMDSWEGIERNYGPLVHIEIKPDGINHFLKSTLKREIQVEIPKLEKNLEKDEKKIVNPIPTPTNKAIVRKPRHAVNKNFLKKSDKKSCS